MSGRLIGKASTVNLTTMSRKRHISAALVTFVELHVQLESGFQNSLYTSAVNFPRIKYFMRVSFLNFQIDPKIIFQLERNLLNMKLFPHTASSYFRYFSAPTSLNLDRLALANTSDTRVWIALRCSGVRRLRISALFSASGFFPCVTTRPVFKNPPTNNDLQISRRKRQGQINEQAERSELDGDNDDHDPGQKQIKVELESVRHALAFIANLIALQDRPERPQN
jgi:hypothetical protein